jgi:hypothetical protein
MFAKWTRARLGTDVPRAVATKDKLRHDRDVLSFFKDLQSLRRQNLALLVQMLRSAVELSW